MWTAKLIATGLIALSLAAAVGSFIHAQRETGRMEIRAQLAKAKAAQEALNAKKAIEGKAHAEKLLSAAQKRAKAADAKAATDAIARQAASDARAAEDREYALWRESKLPAYVAGRLRDATALVAHDADSRGLSGRAGVSPGQGISFVAGGVDQSILGRIRAFLGRANPSDVGGGGAVAK